ncbi:hypothetical protein AaE_013196, partial [Aphanomyces astaci]
SLHKHHFPILLSSDMPINANAVLSRLQDQSIRDQSFLQSSYDEFGDIAGTVSERDEVSNNPIFDRFISDLGSDSVRTMTNFTASEFETLWSVVDTVMHSAWMEGRGRRSLTSPKDSLFMTLVVLKHFSSWDKHAADFGYKAPTFEKLIMRVIGVVQPVLYDISLSPIYAKSTRVTTPIRAPSVRIVRCGCQDYYSGKHGMYGYKIEATVSPNGRCVAMSESHPGSVHDFTIMHSRQEVHKAMLMKNQQDMLLPDHGELSAQYREQWACLVDMGYIGIANTLRGIHPKRRPVNGVLDASDVERNRLISSDRVTMKWYFGRVCALWKASYATFTWSEKNYCAIQRTTFALTNFHLSLMPLRVEDETFYGMVLARYERMANEKK